MALDPIVDSLEGLPEELAKHYQEHKDGGFKLAVRPKDGWDLQDISGLNSAFNKTKAQLQESKQRLEDLGDMDIGAAREALTKVEEMANWTPGEKVAERMELIKKQAADEYGKEISKRDKELDKLRGQVTTLVKTNQNRDALVQHRAKTGRALEAMMALLDRHTKVDFTGEVPVSYVLGDNGEVEHALVDGHMVPVTIDAHVKKMRDDPEFSAFFESSGASGGGGETSDSPTPSQNGPTTSIKWNDSDALSANIEGVADGTVRVLE